MISFNRRTRIFLCKTPTDMRASYDSLCHKTKKIIGGDPFSGHLFMFVNKRRNSCKCLFYDGTGFVIIAKRLEHGLFSLINPLYEKDIVLTPAEFGLFFEGAELSKRFIESPSAIDKSAIYSQKTSAKNINHEHARPFKTSRQKSVESTQQI